MIVCCPSCRTRYRLSGSAGGPDHRGRCSRCDEEFALVLPKHYYRLLPAKEAAVLAPAAVVAAGAAEIGLETATPAAGAAFGAMADAGMASASSAHAGTTHDATLDALEGGPDADREIDDVEGEDAEAASERARESNLPRDFAVTLLFTGAAAAGGYWAALSQGGDPRIWAAGGAGAGLLLAWITVRWVGRRR